MEENKIAKTLSLICLPREEILFSKEQEQVILGSILGDASIKTQSKNQYSFSDEHSAKQKEYILWKNKILQINIQKKEYQIKNKDKISLRRKARRMGE